MLEKIKEKIIISDDDMIAYAIMSAKCEVVKKAARLKRAAIFELLKTKDEDYLGSFVKKQDGTKKDFFVQ